MIDLPVRGRMLKRPVGQIGHVGTLLRFRVDDEQRPDFWLEADVPFPALAFMIAEMIQAGEWKDEKESCEAIEHLATVLSFFAPPDEPTQGGT